MKPEEAKARTHSATEKGKSTLDVSEELLLEEEEGFYKILPAGWLQPTQLITCAL